jgi:hypothetical protein
VSYSTVHHAFFLNPNGFAESAKYEQTASEATAVKALMEEVENQMHFYHRSDRPWKFLQEFQTPTAERLLFNKSRGSVSWTYQ